MIELIIGSEKRMDRLLSINTTGIREWHGKTNHYHRYEATPYTALDSLFREYKLEKTDSVVDFGCGLGRVAFYIHSRFHIPVTGIEANEDVFAEVIGNKQAYGEQTRHMEASIEFEHCLAQHYSIKQADNRFYFFNPFSANIFRPVVENIIASLDRWRRPVDIILYYPMPPYIDYLEKATPFELFLEVKVPGASDGRDKFLVYRFL